MGETFLWIWLAEALGPASAWCGRLLTQFGSVRAIYEADATAYAEFDGLPPRCMQALCRKSTDTARTVEQYCAQHGIGIFTPDGPAYPQRLRGIATPPTVLYYKGKLPYLDAQLCMAVVGTRHLSDYGRRMAYRMGYELGGCGAVIVSGMALGADGMAHQGALDAGAHTIAVFGCGMDTVYPAAHRGLMEQIAEHGTLLTEYAPGVKPEAYHFPQRNRIISGLCQGCVVIEASERSGALITAEHAIRQGRDVFALPANIDTGENAGGNALLREGAHVVTKAADVLQAYAGLYRDTVSRTALETPGFYDLYDDASRFGSMPGQGAAPQEKPRGARPMLPVYRHTQKATGEIYARAASGGDGLCPEVPPTPPKQEAVKYREAEPGTDAQTCAVLLAVADGATADEIAARLSIDARTVGVELTTLEIDGYITGTAGDRFARVREDAGNV